MAQQRPAFQDPHKKPTTRPRKCRDTAAPAQDPTPRRAGAVPAS